MNISIIASISKNGVIGKNNRLPWHIPEDLKWFKKNTMGKTIIMGRKTFDSIGKPLPGRKNIVITRNKSLKIEGCEIYHSISQALKKLSEEKKGEEIFIIGGESIYRETIALSNRLYLTIVDKEYDGDAFFPFFDPDLFEISFYQEHSESSPPYRFVILERKSS
ncbi:MAG: dihydrofolate reductase [Spirochaetes bacterium]|nr:MAG: dihydrofolate reductase [Spirochaetota bacterium]